MNTSGEQLVNAYEVEITCCHFKLSCVGDIQYCSATYRLFKVKPEQGEGTTMVCYLGKQSRLYSTVSETDRSFVCHAGTIESNPISFKLAHNIILQVLQKMVHLVTRGFLLPVSWF